MCKIMTPPMYTISARLKKEGIPLFEFLQERFSGIPLSQVESFFGFTEPCSLYGGRYYFHRELSGADINWMYDNNIHFRIPLTNFYVDYPEYKNQKSFLKKYHRIGNTIIIVNESLLPWIRNDFPLIKIEASAIKNISTINTIV
ncbi:MAG: hypothetical protein IMZ64_05380, partial [Bacteroidetes bacterium]|nr:hypothetical protein [Bacteroidota bacterium]